MLDFSPVKQLIETHTRFVILMHERPDGDTVACSLAFAQVLRQLGKEATCISKDPIPKPFRFLPDIDTIQSDFTADNYDVMFVLDCGDLRRTGFPEAVKQFAKEQQKVVHIDHHQTSDLYKLANIKLFDSTASATGQILYPLFNYLGATITGPIATCLLTSLYYDTGAFKHANTTNEVLELAAQLLHQGAKLRSITQNVELTKSVAALKLWGIALGRTKRHPSLGIVTSVLTQKDIKQCEAREEDVAGIVNLLNSVPGSRAAMLLTETEEGTVRASLRTEDPKVDVAALAELFGGGGLRRASGFCLPGKIVTRGATWHVQLQ
jgi:phosphoesterase RecJ-like protein